MDFDFPEDFLSGLLDSEFVEVANDALTGTIGILEASVKDACSSVISDKSRTELVDSWKAWKKGAIRTKTDAVMLGVSSYEKPKKSSKFKTTNRGKKRTDKTTNNDIAWWLEHGNARQAAKPFIDHAANSVSNEIMQKMQEIYNKKVGAE